MLSKLLFVGGIVASAAARLRFGYADISDCGTGGTEAITFSTFNLSPPKPVRGEPVSFQATGAADRVRFTVESPNKNAFGRAIRCLT
jgi:hypothetical protein